MLVLEWSSKKSPKGNARTTTLVRRENNARGHFVSSSSSYINPRTQAPWGSCSTPQKGVQRIWHVKRSASCITHQRTQAHKYKQLALKERIRDAVSSAVRYCSTCTHNYTIPQEEEAAVAKVMRHVLFKQHQHPDVPIPRAELATIITSTTKRRASSYILYLVQSRFAAVFGMHFEEVQRKTKPTSGAALQPAQSTSGAG